MMKKKSFAFLFAMLSFTSILSAEVGKKNTTPTNPPPDVVMQASPVNPSYSASQASEKDQQATALAAQKAAEKELKDKKAAEKALAKAAEKEQKAQAAIAAAAAKAAEKEQKDAASAAAAAEVIAKAQLSTNPTELEKATLAADVADKAVLIMRTAAIAAAQVVEKAKDDAKKAKDTLKAAEMVVKATALANPPADPAAVLAAAKSQEVAASEEITAGEKLLSASEKLAAAQAALKEAVKEAAEAKKQLALATPLKEYDPWLPPSDPKYLNRCLSVGATGGIVANMSGLGGAISDSGVIDTNKASLANAAGIAKLIVSDKDLATIWYSSQQTQTLPLQGISAFTPGGPLIGVDMGGILMVDFLPFKLPVFVRAGFDYSMKIAGGAQSWTLGKGPDQVASTGGFPIPDGGFEGGTMKVTWDANWIEVPVTIGGIWGVPGLGKVYGGFGFSYFKGGFSIGVDADAKYASFLTSFVGKYDLMVQSPIQENIVFSTQGVSVNMCLGTELTVWGPFAFYCEYYMGGTMLTEFAQNEFNSTGKKGMTLIMGGPAAAGFDPEYIERFAYPTLLGGATLKFGFKYYIL